jgi:hypothetical protein
VRKGPSSRLPGGTGRDAPLGGAGEDFIETKDGEQDDLECDSGNNIARVDFGDRIARPWLCRIMDLDFGELPFYKVG